MKAYISETAWIEFPIAVHEITWEQFNDIRVIEQKFFKANTPEPDSEENEAGDTEKTPEPETVITPAAALQNISESVNHVVDLLDIVMDGDWGEIPFSQPGDNMAQLFKDGFTYNIENAFDSDVTLMRLYVHIMNTIQYYKPVKPFLKYSLKWKGETYYIDPTEAFNALSGIDYTVGETITVLEFQKKAQEKIAEKGDGSGNIGFNLGIQEVAILLRKKNEKLPFKRRERIRFIDQRARLFTDLPLDEILNIRFFFLNILMLSEITPTTNSSSKGLRMKQQQVKNAAKARRQRKSGKTRGK